MLIQSSEEHVHSLSARALRLCTVADPEELSSDALALTAASSFCMRYLVAKQSPSILYASNANGQHCCCAQLKHV
jgi:hypothetical protein